MYGFRILQHYQLYAFVYSETQIEELTSTEVRYQFKQTFFVDAQGNNGILVEKSSIFKHKKLSVSLLILIALLIFLSVSSLLFVIGHKRDVVSSFETFLRLKTTIPNLTFFSSI